jgi:hypothetical protein
MGLWLHLVQGELYPYCPALQHGNSYWLGTASQAHAKPAFKIQGLSALSNSITLHASCLNTGFPLHMLMADDGHALQQVDIAVTPGAHSTEDAVNKQLNDKERVAAALENPALVDMVNQCLSSSYISCHSPKSM